METMIIIAKSPGCCKLRRCLVDKLRLDRWFALLLPPRLSQDGIAGGLRARKVFWQRRPNAARKSSPHARFMKAPYPSHPDEIQGFPSTRAEPGALPHCGERVPDPITCKMPKQCSYGAPTSQPQRGTFWDA